MARARSELVDSSDDEFPDLNALVSRAKEMTRPSDTPARLEKRDGAAVQSVTKTPLRRRKLGKLQDSVLLRPWGVGDMVANDKGELRSSGDTEGTGRQGVRLRTRKQKPAPEPEPEPGEDEEGNALAEGDVTIEEEATVDDSSEFEEFASCNSGSDSEDDDDTFNKISSRPIANRDAPTRSIRPVARSRLRQTGDRPTSIWEEGTSARDLESSGSKEPSADMPKQPARRRRGEKAANQDDSLPKAMISLRIDDDLLPPPTESRQTTIDRPTTPPPSATKAPAAGLVSPTKLPRIPKTPHRPSTDMFWSREFIDDWNDEHSPRKQLFPDANKSPIKASPKKKKAPVDAGNKPISARETKRAFERSKHELATSFLAELDTVITQGKLAELAASTGGIRIVWTNKLNTTAGRASWKRETVTTKPASGSAGGGETKVTHRHRASIELAEKVIDDENRLLNVVAHEFCHLANFMVSGVTSNPHGKEFKVWAARCSQAFGGRGVQVTTKHSYDIDFKYVWECGACGTEFKRHSKSINPERHRCGSCRGELRQTKPVPRKGVGQGPSGYQVFVREQMKLVRKENPGSPQKEIMKIVAERWSKRGCVDGRKDEKKVTSQVVIDLVDEVADEIDALTMEEGK